MISALLCAMALAASPVPESRWFTPTPQMRIEQVYGDMERNRIVRTPRTLQDYYYNYPNYANPVKPFDNYPPMFWNRPVYPYYDYYRPYYHGYHYYHR